MEPLSTLTATHHTDYRKDYSAFEKGVNAMIAEKLIGERGRDYMTARRVSKEYEVFTRGINKSVPSVPPTGSADELKQIEMWQRYISWERSNPLRVEDPALVTKRVMFAYEQVGHSGSCAFVKQCMQSGRILRTISGYDLCIAIFLLSSDSWEYFKSFSNKVWQAMCCNFKSKICSNTRSYSIKCGR